MPEIDLLARDVCSRAYHGFVRIETIPGDEEVITVRLRCNFAEGVGEELLDSADLAPRRATGYELTVFPLCKPTGYEDNTRHNRVGLDLNRQFRRRSDQREVALLERELTAGKFDGLITLHSDDTSEGLYGYTQGRLLNEALLKPALRASARVLPRHRQPLIDGFVASEGLIQRCFDGVLSAPSHQRPQPFDLIFDTPALGPLASQVEATLLALETVLVEYRVFIAHSINH